MPDNYTGDPSALTAREVPVIAVPVDSDPANAASVNTPLEKLCDFTARLQAKAADVGVENDFTDTNPIVLSKAGTQSIAKTNSGDLIVANTVGDIGVLASGGGNATLGSTGGASLTASATALTANKPLAMGTNPITGVVDPSGAQDAATKAYVDARTPARTVEQSSACTVYNFTNTYARITDQVVTMATTGPVVVAMQPTSSGGGLSVEPSTIAYVRLVRDGAVLCIWGLANRTADTIFFPPPAPFVDTPSSGSHTYEFEAASAVVGSPTTGGGGFATNLNVMAYGL